MYKYLDNINSPRELRELSVGECTELCSEIRNFLVKSTDRFGGHLASNLGVTELTVALHSLRLNKQLNSVF